MTELKPCPFCGGSAFLTSARTAHCNYSACCNECTATLSNSSRDALIEEWNSRKYPWISVEDELPETNKMILVYADGSTNCAIHTGKFFFDPSYPAVPKINVRAVTHWMPLPEPPIA